MVSSDDRLKYKTIIFLRHEVFYYLYFFVIMKPMDQNTALKILKSGVNVFLTGEPGSGKTYTINQYVSYLHSHGIKPAITASTGIAATHIGGMTIHSWCGIGIKNRLGPGDLKNIVGNDYIKKRVGPAKILIIDEISMLPPETLGMIDAVCRSVKSNTKPFGGMQVILVGDFFQLPPVTRRNYNEFSQENLFDDGPMRFAYDASVFCEADFATCYITEQYRQDDGELLSLLSKIRSNKFDDIALSSLKQRKVDISAIPEQAPKLYSHNENVDYVNDQMLAKIQAETQYFPMIVKGHEALISAMKKGCLSPENLYLKVGAAVMFTKNNQKAGYVNGTLGVVEGFQKETEFPIVKIRSGRKIVVEYADWIIEEDRKEKGRLSQLPLRLAWAITVHKSQGISLDEAVIDLSRVFEYGQGYVALSRVRRLSGIHLLGWNDKAFQVDPEVLEKDHQMHADSTSAEKLFSKISDIEMAQLTLDFVVKCGGSMDIDELVLPEKRKSTKLKTKTADETLTLWKKGMTISQISETRKLSEGTVSAHIMDLARNGKIKKSELNRALSPSALKDLKLIQSAVKKDISGKLTSIFHQLGGKYSYDDLRFVKILAK